MHIEVISAIFVEKTLQAAASAAWVRHGLWTMHHAALSAQAAVKDEKVEKAKRLLDSDLWVTRCLVEPCHGMIDSDHIDAFECTALHRGLQSYFVPSCGDMFHGCS